MQAIRVRLLGTVDITSADKGRSETLPRQAKRLAVLAYLATAKPRGFHRRDKLLALFWPEANQNQARHSLSQALHVLRTELGSCAIRNRGDGDVAIDDSSVTCDVVEFEQAVATGEFERALELYRGDFLDGLFVNEAPEFELWMAGRRTWLKEKAAGAAWDLAHQHIAALRLVDAERTAQQALLLVSTDESQVRRFIVALTNAGDRAAAVRFYENFTKRLADEYEIEPAPETVECAESLRSGAFRSLPRVASESTSSTDTLSPPARSRFASNTEAEKRTPLRLRYVLAVLVVIAVLVVGVATRSVEEAPLRLAVLPLENLSPDPENAFFAAGLHDEILTQLTGISGLEVLGRTSVSRYSGLERTLTQIAEELRADVIAEGSVQYDNARLRVTVQLIDASSGAHVWAGRYDRDLLDVFEVQTEVATRIAEEVGGALTPNEVADLAQPTQDLEAYTAYLRGHYHSRRHWSVEHTLEAVESYGRAVELDPEFEEAWARLVWVRAWLGTQLGVAGELDSARIALDRLEELSPNSLETSRARGVYLYRTGRYDEGLREFERMREALPRDADVLFNLSTLLRAVGRWEEATQTFVEALRLDPVNPGLAFEVGAIHKMMRRFDESRSYLELSISLDPSIARTWHGLVSVYLWEGDTEGARAVLDSAAFHVDAEQLRFPHINVELFERRPEIALEILLAAPDQGTAWNAMAVTEIAYVAGRYDLSRGYADTLRQAAESRLETRGETDAVTEIFFARANAFSGNHEQAIRHAEQSIELARHALLRGQIQRDVAETYVVIGRHEKAVTLIGQLLSRPGDAFSVDLLRLNPIWDPLRERPDFQALLERYEN